MPLSVISLRIRPPRWEWDPCQVPPPNQRALRADQLTVLINGYSEHRIPLLLSTAAVYSSAIASVSAVIILWSNPSTSRQTLDNLSQNLTSVSTGGVPITVIRQPSASLNLRFSPRGSITTRAVLVCDDDIQPDAESVNFAFNVWRSNPDRLIGFFARSHDYDLPERKWIYTMRSDRYSMILTKLMILKSEYLYRYTCETPPEMLRLVDGMNNCEDILMNFVVSDSIGAGPILVGAKRGVRDTGDARNEGGERAVGLSSRGGEHMKRRGDCITEFHRIAGRMPLRYNYGKVVDSAGEEGLCRKGDRFVYCDQQPPDSFDAI
ncbi:unnamed protein product [Cuscuta campestris]|uniref:Glycosyl transferase 64 domain-containing protein n=1 Tax=Cuscuta campestris TaxID=132261 RepID=A0A484NBT5_9ASTE|nr:unnamed protein product [Cuscuta campestris]